MLQVFNGRIASLGRRLRVRPHPGAADPSRNQTDMRRDGGASPIRDRTILGRFRQSHRGVAAVEFALVAPFLIALLLGGFELTSYIGAIRKLTYVANNIAEMLSQNTTGSINSEDIQFYLNSIVVDFPEILSDAQVRGTPYYWMSQITISSVYFTPTVAGCTSNCTYDAYPAFSGGGNQRPCFIKLQPAADTAPPSPATLPLGAYGPGSVIVIDVVYSYYPRVASKLFGVMTIRRSFYLQPRYVPLIKYDFSNGQWYAQACV